MIIISHRANISGPNTAHSGENHPDSIKKLTDKKINVEIDVWFTNNCFYLGHDCPIFEVTKNFLINNNHWIHCKNIEALNKLLPNNFINLFFHQNDDCTLTSSGYIWSYPREKVILTNKSIAVMPELVENWKNIKNAAGICTDFINNHLKLY